MIPKTYTFHSAFQLGQYTSPNMSESAHKGFFKIVSKS
jgi:hypothetical protein